MILPLILVIAAITMDVLMVMRAIESEGPATIPLGAGAEESKPDDDSPATEPAA